MPKRQNSASSSRPPSSSSSRPFSRGTDAGSDENDDQIRGGEDALRSQGYSLQEIVNDRSFPLDSNLLHTIISSLSHCVPRECIVLPEFRLEELFSAVSRGQFILLSEGKLTESFISFSVLCLYTTLSADVPESFLLNWMLLLQNIISESLVIVQNLPLSAVVLGKTDAQQIQPQLTQRAVCAPLPDICHHDPHLAPFGGDLFDTFHDCVFYMRLLLKESFQFHNQLQQLQEISTPKDFKTNLPNKLPDSMKAVHIYMMSVASFAHCTLTLSILDATNTESSENYDIMKNKITYGEMISGGVNGLTQRLAFVIETLLLALMTTTTSLKELWRPSDHNSLQSEARTHTKTNMSPSLTVMIQQFLNSLQNKSINVSSNDTSSSSTNTNGQTTNHSRHHFFRTISFDASILLAQRVSQVLLHIICDNNTLQVVTTGKKRFLKNVSHPEMPLLLFKIQSVSQLLQPENQSKTMQQKSSTSDSKSNVENLSSDLLSFVQVLPATDESFHIFNQLDIPLLNALFQLEEEEKRKLEAEFLMDEMKVRLNENNQNFEPHQTRKDVDIFNTHEKSKDKLLPQRTNKRNRCEHNIERENLRGANNNNLVKTFLINRKKEEIHDSLQTEDKFKVQLSSPNLKRSSTMSSIEQHKAAISKSQFEKKLNHFNMLKKSFRELFLVFDCLSLLPTTISERQRRQDNVGGDASFVHPFLFVAQKNFGTDFNSMLDECLSSTCDPNKCTSQYMDINHATQQWRCSVFSPDYQLILLQNPFHNMNQNSLPTKQKSKNDGSINENDHASINNSVMSKASFVSKRSLTEQVRHFEALCLHMYQPVVRSDHQDKVYISYRSRVADPLQPVCHAIQCVLDYLWHLCREDRGMCRTRDQQITLLNKQLSKPTIKNKRASLGFTENDKISNIHNEKHSKRQLSSSLPFIEKHQHKSCISSKTRTVNVVSLPSISPIGKKTTPNALDLVHRLSQAKQLAHLEAKLHSLQSDTHQATHNSLWEVLQEQYFAKPLSKNTHDCKEFSIDEETEINESEAFKAKYSQDLSSSNSESDSETDEFNVVSSTNQVRRNANKIGDNNTSHNTRKKESIVWFRSESLNYNVHTFKHKHLSSQDTNSQNPQQTKGSKATTKRGMDTPSDADVSERQGDVIKNMIQQHILHVQQQSLQNNGDIGSYYEAPDHPLRGLPLPVSLSQVYATHLEQKKHQEREIMSQKESELHELQAKLVAENKVFRQRALQLQRQQQLEELQATQAVQQEYDTRRVEWKRKQFAIEEQMKEAKRLQEENEKLRINDIQNMKRFQEMKKENEKNEEMQLQSLMISFVTNAKEHEENLKRLSEEENMRNEETKRFLIEQKQELKRQTLVREQEEKKEKVIQAIARSDHRVRRGNFVWHNGRFGFYDNVRSEEKIPAYIQYTDEPNLYYDPLTKSFLRRKPLDADVTTYTDEARNQYDAIYGVGAYDAYHADLAFKMSVNEHGGYYDNETGEWQVAYGYFDPEKDYEWVPYEGYYDETTGKFIKYAKVQGDLSFMV